MNGSQLKVLGLGLLLGVLGVFAVLGVKSVFTPPQVIQVPTTQQTAGQADVLTNQSQQATNDVTKPELVDLNKPISEQENPIVGAVEEGDVVKELETIVTEQTDVQPQTKREEKQAFTLVNEYGGLQLTLGTVQQQQAGLKGTFVIRDDRGLDVATMRNTHTASFDLEPGIYEVIVAVGEKQSAKMVEIHADEFASEHFEVPAQIVQQSQANNNTSEKADEDLSDASQGVLRVAIRSVSDNTPLKGNIYVQKTNGQHVQKRNYVDGATIGLPQDTYRVTVKVKGKKDVVRNVTITQGQTANQVFKVGNANSATQKPTVTPKVGQLSVAWRGKQATTGGRIVILNEAGERLSRVSGDSETIVPLAPGRYRVMAVYRGQRVQQTVILQAGKTQKVLFDRDQLAAKAQASNAKNPVKVEVPKAQGILQLIAVSAETGQPLKVNFRILDAGGKLLKIADQVSVTELKLAPQTVLVDLAYQDLRGREKIAVKSGEPTVFTFNIRRGGTTTQQQAPQTLEQMLIDRLQQELLEHLN